MSYKQDNKKSYFYTRLDLPNDKASIPVVRDSMNSVFKKLDVNGNYYEFLCEDVNALSLSYYFKPLGRKRLSQLYSICDKSLPSVEMLKRDVGALDPNLYNEYIGKLENDPDWILTHHPNDVEEEELIYQANDLKVFNDFSNWHPWEGKMHNMIFDEDQNFRVPKHRKIYHIKDLDGNQGKSSFVKFLCYKHPKKVAKLGLGYSGQLRSAVVNMGIRLCYLIDLPRTRGTNDKMEDLFCTIEEILGGFVVSPFFGRSSHLMMEPPFVFVFSNYSLPYELLSKDRWECYEVSKATNLDLKKVNLKLRETKESIKKQ